MNSSGSAGRFGAVQMFQSYRVSHSLKKGQGAGQKKGTFDA